jgi:cysteine-rich repeat protein
MKCRSIVPTLLLAATVSACGPSESAQTVGFVLDLGSRRLDRVAFRVRHSSGEFVGTDGSCTPGSLVRSGASSAFDKAPRIVVPAPKKKKRGLGTASSTSSTSTTTSTTMPVTYDCTVTFRLDDAATFGALQWETTYTATGGEFVGNGENIQCRSLTAGNGTVTVFNNDLSIRRLDTGIIALSGFEGPANLSECDFTGPRVPEKSEFAIEIAEAVSVDFEPLDPVPAVVVESIVCSGPPTTTTTSLSTTTTTLPSNPCGNGTLGAGEECDDGNLVNGDGCNSSCLFEDVFEALASPGELTVNLVRRAGIPPGAALAYCKFKGDVTPTTFNVAVTTCSLPGSDGCTTTDAVVKVSTTTTTTTTTTSTTSTTKTTTQNTTSTTGNF